MISRFRAHKGFREFQAEWLRPVAPVSLMLGRNNMNMKKLTKPILFFILVNIGNISFAQESGELGVGVILGNPTGPTIKYWLSEKTAWDLAIGFQEDISVHGDILFQSWEVFPQPQKGKIGGYLGVGAKVQEKKKDVLFGIRAVAGINYWTSKYPIEIFFELVPVFELSPNTDTDLEVGIGLRYYFSFKIK